MRVVVGYTGGLETAATIPWLAETYRAEVIALTLDLGQGGELEAVRDEALEGGAARAHVLDVREEFARDYVLPALRADALDDRGFPMPAALGRPLIARKLVEIAGMEAAGAIAHGASDPAGPGGCLERAARALNPSLRVIAAAGEWDMTRPDVRQYARARGLSVRESGGAYRATANLWGRSILSRDARASDGWPPPPELYTRTKAAAVCPSEPASVEIAFERGEPVAVNGVAMSLVELVAALDAISGGNGVGRLAPNDREVREAPAAVVLHTAHDALRARMLPDLGPRCQESSAAYAGLIRDGLWFTPARRELDAFEERVQDCLTGAVRLRLCQGDCRLVGVS